MSEVDNVYVESVGRSTTILSVDPGFGKASLLHTPGDNETWAYLWNCEVDHNSVAADVVGKLHNSTLGVNWAQFNIEPQDATNLMSVGGVKVHTYGASPGLQTIGINFWSEGGVTAGCSDAHIFGLKLGANDKYIETDDTPNGNATSTPEVAVTLNEDLNGNYLFLCSCEYTAGTVGDIKLYASKDGVDYGTIFSTVQDTTTWRTWTTGFVLTGLAGAQTVTISFLSEDNATNVQVRRCRILAIDLATFNTYSYEQDRARTLNSTATPSDKSTLAFSPSTVGEHLALAGMIIDVGGTSNNGFAEFERDGTAINQAQEEMNENGDRACFFSLRRESLSALTTYKNQWWNEATTTTGAAESWIVVIDLEAAPTIPIVAEPGLHAIEVGRAGVEVGLHGIEQGIV